MRVQIVRDSAFDFNHLRTGRLSTSKRQLQRDNSTDEAQFGKVHPAVAARASHGFLHVSQQCNMRCTVTKRATA